MSDNNGKTEGAIVREEAFIIPKWFAYLVGFLLIPVVGLIGQIKLTQTSHDARLAVVEAESGKAALGRDRLQDQLTAQTKEIVALRIQIERLLARLGEGGDRK